MFKRGEANILPGLELPCCKVTTKQACLRWQLVLIQNYTLLHLVTHDEHSVNNAVQLQIQNLQHIVTILLINDYML